MLVQDLDSIHEISDFGLSMKHRLEQLTDRIGVIPVRSDNLGLMEFPLFNTLSYRLEIAAKTFKCQDDQMRWIAVRSDFHLIGLPSDRVAIQSVTNPTHAPFPLLETL